MSMPLAVRLDFMAFTGFLLDFMMILWDVREIYRDFLWVVISILCGVHGDFMGCHGTHGTQNSMLDLIVFYGKAH
jgi:hypothetical protein